MVKAPQAERCTFPPGIAAREDEMRFGSFIVTFNRPAVLKKTIEINLAQSRPPEVLLIVDNGNSKDTEALVKSIGDPRIVYEAPGENLGSAGGCAYGLEWFYERGYTWIHCGDDDDPPRILDTFERLLDIVDRVNDPKLGIVAAWGSWFDWDKGQYKRIPDDALHGLIDVDTVGGNSQLTVSRETIKEIGAPDKRFFFGSYDPLYSLRVKQAGFRIVIDGDLTRRYRTLADRLGYEQRQSIVPRDSYNSIWRRYYVTRNYIYRMTRTFGRPDLARRQALKALVKSLTCWMRGPRYGLRFSTLQLRGVWDGYRGNLGRTVLPNPKTAAELKTRDSAESL